MFTQRTAQERLREVKATILEIKNNGPTPENQNRLLIELGQEVKLEHKIAKQGHALFANPVPPANPVPAARTLFK